VVARNRAGRGAYHYKNDPSLILPCKGRENWRNPPLKGEGKTALFMFSKYNSKPQKKRKTDYAGGGSFVLFFLNTK